MSNASTVSPARGHTMLGVKGTMQWVTTRSDGTHAAQSWISKWRDCSSEKKDTILQVSVRFDDSCKNGHDSFAVTAVMRLRGIEVAGGMLREDIARAFPELAPLLKWHLTSTDGPMHYIANTVFLAGDRDYDGLRAGENRQLISGHSGLPMWEIKAFDDDHKPVGLHMLGGMVDAAKRPACDYTVHYAPVLTMGQGKGRNLAAARSCAVWPEATDEELCVEPEVLRTALQQRLPALMAQFKADMIGTGFEWGGV
jgi:hypothetical protein